MSRRVDQYQNWSIHSTMSYESVKRWMSTRQNLKPSYRLRCLDALQIYSTYRGMNPEQLLNEYVKCRGNTDFRERVKPEDHVRA